MCSEFEADIPSGLNAGMLSRVEKQKVDRAGSYSD